METSPAISLAGNIQVGPNGMIVYAAAVSNNFGTITSNISDVPQSRGGRCDRRRWS